MAKTINYTIGKSVINGKEIRNSVIEFKNGCMYVNGKPFEDWSGSDEKVINITINGNIESLMVDSCSYVNIQGDVNISKVNNGDIIVKGHVKGEIKASNGDVSCWDVSGDVFAYNGDIRCRYAKGSVAADNGDIYRQ